MAKLDFVGAAKDKLQKNSDKLNFTEAARKGIDFTWNEEAKNRYISSHMSVLEMNDGTKLGKITSAGLDALSNGEVDSYTPFNDEEKNTINAYKSYLDEQPVEVKITDKKSITLKHGTVKAIDSFVENNKEKSKAKKAEQLDKMVEELGLDESELESAKSYAGIKKLSIYSGATDNNSVLKEASQPFAKFLAGAYDAAEGASRFFIKSGLGGLLDGGSYNEGYAYAEKFFSENPDALGHALFEDHSLGPTEDYIENVRREKALEYYDNTHPVTRFISDVGFRSAGQMLGSAAMADASGATGLVQKAGNVIKGVSSGTKAGKTISKIVNATPKIKTSAATGIKGKVANAMVNKVNSSLSVGNAVKFLNPLNNPTTTLMGINAAQDKYDSLIQMGYSKEQAMSNALFTGYVNTVTEKMGFDGTPQSMFLFNGKAIAGDVSTSAAKNTKNAIKKYFSSSVSEGIEEIYASVFDRAGDYFSKVGYVDENGQIQQRKLIGDEGVIDFKNIGESFLGGFVGGAVMGSVGVISNIANHDIDTVHEYADEVKREIAESNKAVVEAAEAAGVENVSMPEEPNWKSVTVEEINDYVEKSIVTHKKLISDAKVVQHDTVVLQNATEKIDAATSAASVNASNTTIGPTENRYTVDIGDVFTDTYTGNTISVISRDAENTVVEIDTGTKSERRTYSNSQADTLATSEQYEQTASAEPEASEAVNKATQPVEKKSITLTQVGDFYEAYGDAAVEIAKKLNLTPTTKAINGVDIPMVGFPVQSLDNYKSILGDSYSITIADAPTVTNTNKQNMSVSGENITADEIATNIDDKSNELPEAFRRSENGKIYFNQLDIDYENSTMRKGEFNIVVRSEDDVKIEKVSGFLCGKYGLRKIDRAYGVTLLQSGLHITSFTTQKEGKKFIEYVNNKLSFNEVEYTKTISGKYLPKSDVNLKQYTSEIKQVIEKEEYKTKNTEKNIATAQLFENFDDVVDDILSISDDTAKKYADNRVAVKVLDKTPNVILDNIKEAKDLKVIINYTKLYLAVRENGVFKGHYHNLGSELVKKLPDFLTSPDAIVQLDNGRLNVFTSVETESGNNGIVSVELNSTKDISGKNEDYNVIVTLFSSNDNYIQNLLSRDGVQVKYKKTDLSQVNPQLYKWLATINDKSVSTDIVSQDETDVKSNLQTDSPTLTSACALTATKHTKTGEDMWVVSLNDRISKDEFAELKNVVKSVGGYYSPYAKAPDGKSIPGFIFKKEPGEDVINAFNDFFKNDAAETETSTEAATDVVSEVQPTEKTETSNDILKNDSQSDIIKENASEESVDNDAPEHRVLDRESKSDDSGLHSEASETADEEGTRSVDDKRGNDGRDALPQSDGSDADRSNGRDDSERVHRGNDTDDVDEKAVRSTAEDAAIGSEAPETIETEDKSIEKKRPSNKGNFVITNDIALELDTNHPSAADNIAAIELLIDLENEGRPATAEEKRILAKYKGWGGIDTRRLPWDLNRKLYQLYDGSQLRDMQSSTNNAFFTPTKVIDAMYAGLKRMGFKGGNILETSMGVGNFFGRMPAAISAKSSLTGVEFESYTARIAQYLYPGATVINKPFQDVAIKNGSYDLVIGNVPFGTNKISYNKKKYALHNYFIISSLDKVKDGGIVAVITSAGTLDSYTLDARKAIMDRADVVACYKLPAGVFSRNADTDVQTDLLIFKKRAHGDKPSGDSILNVVTTDKGLKLNEYFVKHPENILGTLAEGTNAWGKITTVLNDGKFEERLDKAMKKLPKGLISGSTELKPIETIMSLSSKPRFFEKNGKIYADDGAGTATAVSSTREKTVRDYMAVRDAYKAMLDAYNNDLSETEIKPLRDTLIKAYDTFYKNHTAITGDGKKKIGDKKCKNNTFLEADADYYLVSGLEYYNAKTGTFEKSALFNKDTLRKKKVSSVEVASDALAVSLNESGKIDFARMSELTGKSEKQLAEELKGEIVLTPEGEYVLTDIYLSGDIYEKLEAVKDKPEFKEQKEMLEKVLPTPKDASSIMVKLGANYIDPSYVKDFAREVLDSRLEISKDNSGRWNIEGVRQTRYGQIVNIKYGCNSFNAVQLLEKILNDAEITATKHVEVDGKKVSVMDPKETEVAKQKAEDIKAAFETWIFKDSSRRADIVNKYNRTYNNYRPLDYEHIAEKLSFDSMNETLKTRLYPHQKKGIARFLFGGNILFAHGVGTGKTFEMIASVMEAKRMGIINKAAMVVPNNKVVDFKRDIAEAYPNAKVLVIDTANKKRQTMLGLVNSNDWDIVLIARTTFTKIPVGAELQANYINQQMEDLNYQISLAGSNRDISRRQLKGLITQRDNLEQKLKDLNSDVKRDESSVEFEKLGIDCICVDEAHNYKSILTPSKLDIKGLVNRNNAQMANDMLMKLDYLRSIDGKIIFGTGTPITNTVSEIYNMMRMVRPDILESAGIRSLDEWVNTFAKIDSVTELGIDNKIKSKSTQVIRSFINSAEMIGMFRQFADVVFTTDVVKNLPKAKYVDIKLDGTEKHRAIEQQISDVIQNAPKTEQLKVFGQVMAMADAASVDLRMLSGADSAYNIYSDYSLDELDYPESKINVMCGHVLERYNDSKDIKGTQIIFCDKGSGSGTVYSFNLHKDIMNKLVEKGIPKEEIVIIKDQSDAQLEELYKRVNDGEVRVLIGTSQKMAEGLNVQKRVVAIHHPTVTYKPSDKEQGDARGIRAGNINDEVYIYRYLQGNTFDSHKWQAVDRKGEMINKALRGENVAELEDIGADEDSGAGVDAATAMAITSGNPLVKDKVDIDKEVIRLKTLKQSYMGELYRYQDIIAKNPGLIRQYTALTEAMEKDIALKEKYGDNTAITIKGKAFKKQTDANRALVEAVKNAPKNGKFTKLGEYNGFDIMFKGDTGGMNYAMMLKGANEYSVEYTASGNNIARFAGVTNRISSERERLIGKINLLKNDLGLAKQEVNKPFSKEADLAEALEKQKDITYRYEHYNDEKSAESSEIADNEDTSVHSSRDASSSDSDNRWNTERVENNDNSKSSISDLVKSTRDIASKIPFVNISPAEESTVSISDIVKKIQREFGIPISTGKVTDREASGIYKDTPEVIRTRIANNLPTISHELGHHFDKLYGLSNLESVAKLKETIPDGFLDNYSTEEKSSEAVAEFVRVYLKNTGEANTLCPEFYNDFIRALSKEDLKSLNEIAAAVNKYLSYSASERYDAAIVTSKEYAKSDTSLKDKTDEIRQKWIDPYLYLKNAVDYVEKISGGSISGKNDAYRLATNALNSHSISNFLLTGGMRDLDGNIISGEKSFIECIAEVNSENMKLLDKYLVLRHSLEWIAPEQEDVTKKRVFADDTLEDVDEIKKQIAAIEDEHPEIKTAAENLYEYQNNVLKHFVIPAGGMTSAMLEDLNRKYPSYVPFYRAIKKDKSLQGKAKSTFVNQRSPIKRAKGSGELIMSPLESIIKNTEKMVNYSLRNQVGAILAHYSDTVDGFGQFMEKVAPDMIPHVTDISVQKGKFTDALQQIVSSGDDYFAVSELLDNIFGDSVTDFTPIANANKRIVTVVRNGTPSYYQIHDEDLYKSVAELAPKQLKGFGAVDFVMNFMKLCITQNNPIFATTNAMRDFGTAYKLSEINNPVKFTEAYIEAAYGIITKSENYKLYKAMGGGHSSELSASIDDISKTLRNVANKDMGKARRLAYSILRHPVETVAALNDAVESVPRFMEFVRTLDNGGDLQEAIYNANDITTNFRRQGAGATAKVMNKFFLFNNAAIQGLDKTARTLTAKDTQKRNKTWLKYATVAIIGGLIRHFWNKEVDEEGYNNLSSYKKNNFYNYAIGDGMFISLPKERENAVLDSLVERVFESLSGNEEAFYDFGGYLSSQLIPPMIPSNFSSDSEHSFLGNALHSWAGSTVFGGVVDIVANQDFKGAPIEGAYEKQYTKSNERYDENTTKIAYALGQTKFARYTNLSPKKIDHLISSYTGILGQINEALFPMNDERRDVTIGLRNKFISDSNYSTDVLNKMYENKDKAKLAFEYEGTIDTAVEYEKNALITSYISSMNKAVKALPENEQKNGRAYLLKALASWNYDDTTSQTEMKQRFAEETVTDDYILTELPNSTLEWSANKVKYTYQMTPQEYDEYVKDYLNMVEKYRTQQSKRSKDVTKYATALDSTNSEVKKVINNKYRQKYYKKATKAKKE